VFADEGEALAVVEPASRCVTCRGKDPARRLRRDPVNMRYVPADRRIRLTLPERLKVIEERRKASEAVLWQLPAVSLAAQAFLLTAGLSADAKAGSQMVVGLLGIAAVLGTGLVVGYQALRATTLGHWVQSTLTEPLAAEDLPRDGIGLNALQIWLLDHLRNVFYFPWILAGLAFLAADVYVLAKGIGRL
jgi:hypothetical protein